MVVVVVVVVVRRDTQWWNGGTKDTTVRRKRVVMGRESRGVLLLVALAVLAAVDAFSTDSKSAFFSQHARCIFIERQRAKGERGRRRGGRRERERARELVLKSLARIHPAPLDKIRATRSRVSFLQFFRRYL